MCQPLPRASLCVVSTNVCVCDGPRMWVSERVFPLAAQSSVLRRVSEIGHCNRPTHVASCEIKKVMKESACRKQENEAQLWVD